MAAKRKPNLPVRVSAENEWRPEGDLVVHGSEEAFERAIPYSAILEAVEIEPDEHGQLAVVRSLGTADFACKEIVFSVDTKADDAPRRAFYTATVCRDGQRWKWASAEPATERWGSLQ